MCIEKSGTKENLIKTMILKEANMIQLMLAPKKNAIVRHFSTFFPHFFVFFLDFFFFIAM